MSVTANIRLRKPNFSVINGYFYTFDQDSDMLLQKTDDGTTAFSYPCDTLLSNEVKSLEYDGVYFWSLEFVTDTAYIKKWKIDNYVCKLRDSYTLSPATFPGHTVNTDAITLEHYHTTLSTTISGGNTTIYIGKYYNKPEIIVGATLHLGPNSNGNEEDVKVASVVYQGVTLTTPVIYAYAAGDPVNFHTKLWMFNNYDGTDSSKGALYKFDPVTTSGSLGYITRFAGGAYKDIKACTFCSIDSFTALGDIDMLLYVKSTNTLFVNSSEFVSTLYDASTVNDTFTTTINSTWWSTNTGTPSIQSNKLYLDLGAAGSESILSKYYVSGDFDVYVTGNLNTYDVGYGGAGYYSHSLAILFKNESDRFYKVSRGYSTEFGGVAYQNFNAIARLGSDTVISGSNASGVTDYDLRLRRVGSDMHSYYRVITGGVPGAWVYLGVQTMFSSEAQILLMASTSVASNFYTYFDNLTYTSGKIAYVTTATALPFYGSMVMDNVESDGYTVDPLYDMSVDRGNLYRLHLSTTYSYNLSPLDPFVTSISISASPAIIAANGLSTSTINAWVKDQFLQPIVGRLVTFSENGTGSLLSSQGNTDSNGYVSVVYRAGTSTQSVTITAVVQQTN